MDYNINRLASTKRNFSDLEDEQLNLEDRNETCSEINGMDFNYEEEKLGKKRSERTQKGHQFENGSSNLGVETKHGGDENSLNQTMDQDLSNFSEVLGKLGQDAKMVILQYSQAFNASEVYEQQSVQAVTELGAHATVLEQRLKLQKELLCNRLQEISSRLNLES